MMKSKANNSLPEVIEKNNMKTKLWRRLWHLLGGLFFPILAIFVSKDLLLITLGVITGIFIIWEALRLNNARLNKWSTLHIGIILRDKEQFQPTGTTLLLLASLIVFLLFDKYIAITALLFVAIGDLAASVVGEKYGKHMVLDKSWEGSTACLVSCLAIGMLMTRLSPTMTIPVVAYGAIYATVFEILPIPVDDNFTMPLFSAMAMTWQHCILV
jgi:dolichol kinase